jgi:hypothetical protein
MKKFSLTLLPVVTAILVFVSCSKSSPASGGGTGGSAGSITFSCTGITPKFSADIQPILTSVCSINSNCHSAGSLNSGGPFTTYAEVFAKRSNIRAAILAGTMPQTGTLSQAQINAFICWIDSGAGNN